MHKYISQRCKNDLFYSVESEFVYGPCVLYFYFHALGIMMKINMYRKVIISINFAAFVLFWIIIWPLDMYGQESKWGNMKPVRERYLRSNKDFAVDSVKYSILGCQKLFISTKSDLAFQFKKGGPFFYTDQSPLHKGEYNVSGVIGPLWNGHIYGMGRQMNLIGIGVFNYAAIGYNKSLSDNLFADVALHAMKLSTPRHVDETLGISGKLSYSFNSRMSLHVFGGFLFTPVTSFSRNDYGGSIAFDITDSFGTELGIRGYREYPFERGGVTPILMPYYKLKSIK